ncbi:hypothetical protein [Mycolicibacterium fortuitum]|uniref:hypothetical protein n=1 Tax=Mycolicibacterium fortuitum TaxID=1766 RepID=UPI001041E370|nr:hypothetical protein [Mycolicibacterium fortuitum]
MAIYQIVGIVVAPVANLVALGSTVHSYANKLRAQSLDTATAFADMLSKYVTPPQFSGRGNALKHSLSYARRPQSELSKAGGETRRSSAPWTRFLSLRWY